MADTFAISITGIEDVITQLQTLRRLTDNEKILLEELSTQLNQEGLEGPAYEEYRQEYLRLSKTAIVTAALIDMTIACFEQTAQNSIQNDKSMAEQYAMGSA